MQSAQSDNLKVILFFSSHFWPNGRMFLWLNSVSVNSAGVTRYTQIKGLDPALQ